MPTSKPPPRPPRRRRVFISAPKGERDGYRFYLKEWREFRGMSQEDLAAALKTSKGEISRYERGHRAYSLLVQFRLAKALSIKPWQFFFPPDFKSADAMLEHLSPEEREHYLSVLEVMMRPPKSEP
jgi:transcriptional regulator with XRE-family HTH domain